MGTRPVVAELETAAHSPADPWSDYLRTYHHDHPGITERVLSASVHPGLGTPYQWLRSAVPPHPTQVLDIACGSAAMQTLFPDSDYLGIDVSDAELDLARARGRGPVLAGDALAVPARSESVDVVVCSMAIMLLRPIERAMAEIARVLRPGGTFVAIWPVSLPIQLRDLRIVAPLVLGLRHVPEVPQHFTRRGLTRVLTGAELRTLSLGAARFAHPLVTADDAHLAVEALYLPHVSPERREIAARRLADAAALGRELPVSISRLVAVRRP